MIAVHEIARVAYEAWCDAMGHRIKLAPIDPILGLDTRFGWLKVEKGFPIWDNLPPDRRHAWIAAIEAALRASEERATPTTVARVGGGA